MKEPIQKFDLRTGKCSHLYFRIYISINITQDHIDASGGPTVVVTDPHLAVSRWSSSWGVLLNHWWRLKSIPRTSLVVQWLRLHTSNAGGRGSIPGQGTRSHMQCGMAKKLKFKTNIEALYASGLLDQNLLSQGLGPRFVYSVGFLWLNLCGGLKHLCFS